MRERSLDADLALALTLNARGLLRDEPLKGTSKNTHPG